MTYFSTPQRPRRQEDSGGIFETVMKYVGGAGKGAVIGAIATGTPQGAAAGAALGAFGAHEGTTAYGAKEWSERQKNKKQQEQPEGSPMAGLGPGSPDWYALLGSGSAA